MTVVAERCWTAEQADAIDRRQGDLLLEAAAGSGKTAVLVERFVRSVLEDGIEVSRILTITFTEKAAAELRARIRERLRELGAEQEARAAEAGFISTIHGFCARLLRGEALAAGLDPRFQVLEETEAERLAALAFDDALERLIDEQPEHLDVIAAYGAGALRSAILDLYDGLRARGQTEPHLPPLPPAPELAPLRRRLVDAALAAAAELGAIEDPGVRVIQALERLEACGAARSEGTEWPGELAGLALPGGNGSLSSEVCEAYREALEAYRGGCAAHHAVPLHGALGRLLELFGTRYAARKRTGSSLDFADLELRARDLLRASAELRDRYRERFARVMVDEFQDTNHVQLELVEAISRGNLFTVGDAQQSIYGFRHADVELFRRRAAELAERDAHATLQTNFRSRPEVLTPITRAFSQAGEDSFRPLLAARESAGGEVRTELRLVDKGAAYEAEGPAAPWRQAEARVLAARVAELLRGGTTPRDVVVLTRATTDLRVYEQALEAAGVPTYVIGGRGYWEHPQVLDLLAYLRALANPGDGEALISLLGSPMVGVSLDALVVLCAAARAEGVSPWIRLQREVGALEVAAADAAQLQDFLGWFSAERRDLPRRGVEDLIERVLAQTDYDLAVLALPGGARRLANVRKLMRLGREHEARHGRNLRAFLDEVDRRRGDGGALSREGEAPVEGEALAAVRMMTIHRAKGLEFEVVCVADLGRGAVWRPELVRVGADGRLGFRVAQPGGGPMENALDWEVLGAEQQAREAAEERRLFYVAMTRARERLVLTGAARLERWPAGGSGGPVSWIAPAFVPDIAERAATGNRNWVHEGVGVELFAEDSPPPEPPALEPPSPPPAVRSGPGGPGPSAAPADPLPATTPSRPPVSTLSYSALAAYERCAYRFYAERVLGLPPTDAAPALPARPRGAATLPTSPGGLVPAERGRLLHRALERIDFCRPQIPDLSALARQMGFRVTGSEAEELRATLEAFASSALCARLGGAARVRREEPFALLHDELLISGVFDVLARLRDGGLLVVDYKSDELRARAPAAVAAEHYARQRLIYALAALKLGAPRVEVIHVFLAASGDPVIAVFDQDGLPALSRELSAATRPLRDGRFPVTEAPHPRLCAGCPARGGLCSWPLEATERAD